MARPAVLAGGLRAHAVGARARRDVQGHHRRSLIRQGVPSAGDLHHRASPSPQDGVEDVYSAEAHPFDDPAGSPASSWPWRQVSLAQLGVLPSLGTIAALSWFLAATRTGRQMQRPRRTRQSPHPRRQRRAYDPLHIPHQRGAGGDGLAADLAHLSRQFSQRRDAGPGGLRGSHRRRLQPGARRPSPAASWSASSTTWQPPTCPPPTAGSAAVPAGAHHPVPSAGLLGRREERAV